VELKFKQWRQSIDQVSSVDFIALPTLQAIDLLLNRNEPEKPRVLITPVDIHVCFSNGHALNISVLADHKMLESLVQAIKA